MNIKKKDKKAKTGLHGFIETINESKRKPIELWVDQRREFYNSPLQKWLDSNDILMHSTHNEGKSIVAERFIRTLKGKIYKKMIANDSKSYIGYLNKLVFKYNHTYHLFIGKKPIDADYSALTEQIEPNHKALKFKVGDRARISKYKNIFSKVYTEHWSREIFAVDSVLKINLCTCKIKDLNVENLIVSFYEKE